MSHFKTSREIYFVALSFNLGIRYRVRTFKTVLKSHHAIALISSHTYKKSQNTDYQTNYRRYTSDKLHWFFQWSFSTKSKILVQCSVETPHLFKLCYHFLLQLLRRVNQEMFRDIITISGGKHSLSAYSNLRYTLAPKNASR